ncbi:MAG: GvpL/GvpF family gas vesicle protein [Thermoleophilaceae bacterium]
MSARDADELIREAHAEARAAVKARLREDFERALTHEVEERLRMRAEEDEPSPPPPPRAPSAARRPARGASHAASHAAPGASSPAPTGSPPAPVGDALWAYCVVRGDAPELPAAVAGVQQGSGPRLVRDDGAAVVVSAVPLAEFGEEALKRNLNDLAWLESVARAHERVVDAALAGGSAVVPMRMCTIFQGERQVRQMLADRGPALRRALERLDGMAEWGVKVTADRERLTDVARDTVRAPGGAAGAGGAYLGRKRQDRELSERADALLDGAIRESHARLEEWAAASEVLPPQGRELADYDGDMVFNGAYLVDEARAASFASMVDELGRQYAEHGLTFELTGPWPAFHFVGVTESLV